MKKSIGIVIFFLVSILASAQTKYEYIKSAEEIKGKRTIYTEIEINASPEVVRAKYLEFKKWSEWNSVLTNIAVKTGDIDNLETRPTLDLTLDLSRKKDPSPAPLYPEVYYNNEEIFVWGFKKWVLQADHVFVFESINNGKGTRFIHYEKMSGLLSPFIITKKVKANVTKHYNIMNEELKKLCEDSLQ